MQSSQSPIIKDLVLIGGGHSHAIALQMFGMKPLAGVRITLITKSSHTPYSGMLPGHIAGFYNYDQSHIDLRPLANFAQAQLFINQVVGLDLINKKVICANRPNINFDILSIDIGSTPATINVLGAVEYATAIKPVENFLIQWNQLIETATKNPQKPICLSIVGGGAGGVELSLAIESHLRQILTAENFQIHLFHSSHELMPSYNQWVRHRFEKILTERGIKLHLNQKVREVQPHKVVTQSGLEVECDHVFWVTQASAPKWIKDSGLTTDEKGFILVSETLQSLSHPEIFAAGDIATLINHPRPKSGVFAVRQGKPLFENLQRIVLGKPLKSYIPQKQFLSLIGTGNGSAIASWGILGAESPLFWRWKDYIDRKFMSRFTNFPSI